MLSNEIVRDYEEYWSDKISNSDYSDIDDFCEAHNLSDDEIDELLILIPNLNFSDEEDDE
jgi:hypothetical protein